MLDPSPKERVSSGTERHISANVATLSTEKDSNICQLFCSIIICWLFTLITCVEQSSQLKFQGLWVVWLRARIQISLQGMCKLSFCPAQQELSSRTWLLRSQLRGAAWMVAVPCQAGFAVLLRPRLVLPRLLLCFSFLFLFLLS